MPAASPQMEGEEGVVQQLARLDKGMLMGWMPFVGFGFWVRFGLTSSLIA